MVVSKKGYSIAVAGLLSAAVVQANAQAPSPGAGVTLEVTLSNRDTAHYTTFVSDITIKNLNPLPVHAIDISCPVLGPSGSMIQRYDFRISEAVPAKGEKTFKKHIFGYWPTQAVSVNCTGSKRL